MNNKQIKSIKDTAHDRKVELRQCIREGKMIPRLETTEDIYDLIERLCMCLEELG